MEWVLFTSVLAAWAGQGMWHGTWAQPSGGDGSCPSPEDYSLCSCYHFNDGVFVECSGVAADRLAAMLTVMRHIPIKSLNVYDLEAGMVTLPPALFVSVAGISSLKISHSTLQHLGEDSLVGLKNSLHTLSIMHSYLSTVPHAALTRLPRLKTLDLEANNITELHSYSFFNMSLTSLNLKGNGLRQISEYAFEGLEESLEELNLVNNRLKQLPIPALWRLARLRSLQASSNHISDVLSGGYWQLRSLKALDLSNNHFTQVSASSLSTMPALLSLSLAQNHIHEVAGDSFIQNSGLQRIYMSHNGIMNLAAKTFTYTLGVRVVDLNHNHLHNISPGLFTNLPQLQELFLAHNNILKLSNRSFINSTRLAFIYLQNNQIHTVESDALMGLSALYDLQLHYNKLTTLPQRFLTHTPALAALSLDHNQLTALVEGIFSQLPELRELRLHSNKLSRVERGVFAPLPNLEELHLHDNQIYFVAKEAFSSLTSLQHLNLEGNRLVQLPDALSHFPGNLVTLQYSKNQLTTIHMDALRAQTKLQILWLNDNNLTSVQHVLLEDLSFMLELYLEKNQISFIQDKCFQGMQKLKLLQLSHNQLQHISSLLFDGLMSLEFLYLNHNRIRNVEPGTFQNLGSLRHLDLSHNEIVRVRRYMFKGQLPLQQLIMSHAHISEVDSYAFSGLKNLEELDLSHNSLAHLMKLIISVPSIRIIKLASNPFEIVEEDTLYDLPNLEYLDLSGCGLFRLPPHFLYEAFQLHTLLLSRNSFANIPSTFFQKMRRLKEIDLSHNNFSTRILSSVEGHTKLEILRANNNPLEELREPLSDLPSLSDLNLSNTRLRRLVHTAITRLKNLRNLDLSGNRLFDLPPGFLSNARLDSLSLADNSFSEIPAAIFLDGVASLKALNLTGNPLRRLTDPSLASKPALPFLEEFVASRTNLTMLTNHDFALTPGLQHLDLSHASIEEVAVACFRNLTRLAHLNLASNRLQMLHTERLRGLKALAHLNLTNNSLKKLDPLPAASHSLKVLDASGNKLMGVVETAFRHTTNLEALLLGSNLITNIHPDTFHPLASLRRLDLSHNYLQTLDATPLEPLERSLEWIQLDGNPWECNCGLRLLWGWLQDHISYLPDPSALACHKPKALRGASFLQLPSSVLCPQPLIVRLAVRDIQSQSVMLSWHASNDTTFSGFRVSFGVMGGNGEQVEGLMTTRSVPSSHLRSFLVSGLRPSTTYLACVRALTLVSSPDSIDHQQQQQQQQHIPVPHQSPDLSSKCMRVRTNEPPPAELQLTNRLAIMIGVSLGIFIFFGAGTVICCRQVCKERREAAKAKLNNSHGNSQDYHSYRQFSIQENDASANPPQGQTEC